MPGSAGTSTSVVGARLSVTVAALVALLFPGCFTVVDDAAIEDEAVLDQERDPAYLEDTLDEQQSDTVRDTAGVGGHAGDEAGVGGSVAPGESPGMAGTGGVGGGATQPAPVICAVPESLPEIGDPVLSGSIAASGLLVARHGPYRVQGDVFVLPGVTLAIGPGVEIRFDGNHLISVKGELVVAGEQGREVLFTSGRSDPGPGAWNEIVFDTTGAGSICHAVIEHASHGVRAVDAQPVLSNTEIRYCEAGIQIEETDSSAVIDHCTITDNHTGIVGDWAGWRTGIEINASRISRNNTGITMAAGGSYRITNNVITDNTDVGILSQGGVVSHNVIARNGIGIDAASRSEITFNVIEANDTGVRVGMYPTDSALHHNTIADNTGFGVEYVGGLDEGTVDAIENWWGTNDADRIGAAIWDVFDDPGLFDVKFVPFLEGPDPSVGPVE